MKISQLVTVRYQKLVFVEFKFVSYYLARIDLPAGEAVYNNYEIYAEVLIFDLWMFLIFQVIIDLFPHTQDLLGHILLKLLFNTWG